MKKNKYKNRSEFDLRHYFWCKMKGFNNSQTKNMMGCGLRTVQLWSKKLQNMSDEEFMTLLVDNNVYFKPIEKE